MFLKVLLKQLGKFGVKYDGLRMVLLILVWIMWWRQMYFEIGLDTVEKLGFYHSILLVLLELSDQKLKLLGVFNDLFK
jgi:hypothetical protein